MKQHQQPGYILLLTFSMLVLCVALVSAAMIKGLTHKKVTTALLYQDQMSQFTASLPALAQSLLLIPSEDKKEQPNKTDKKPAEQAPQDPAELSKKILEKVLPVVNKSQKFMMKEIEKEFPVIMSLTFFCESGKINVNGLYDMVHKQFYDQGVAQKDKLVFATWLFDRIATLTDKPSLLQPFIEHVKQRKIPFNDVTELLAIKEFAACFAGAVFYEPKADTENIEKKHKKLFLTDIFTVTSEHDTIQPWLLSPSVCVLLDIAQHKGKQEKKDGKSIDLSNFKQQADWQKDWDLSLQPWYDVTYNKIPESVRGMLATDFSVSAFSVFAQVTFKALEQENASVVKIFAILKEKILQDKSIAYDVIKIYQV